jgi:hypothetical protein
MQMHNQRLLLMLLPLMLACKQGTCSRCGWLWVT